MRRLLSLFAPVLVALASFAAPASAQQSQFFNQPSFSGIPVDHCAEFGRACGQSGADLFCQRTGFDAAASFETQRSPRTYVIGSARQCATGNCTALRDVTCVNQASADPAYADPAGPQTRRFINPTEDGIAIDHCVRFGRNCGRAGARQFCEIQGFKGAIDHQTYRARRTYVMGDGRYCESGNCTAFSSITCSNADNRGRVVADGPSGKPSAIGPQLFSFPSVRGVAVDHCAQFGRNCGRGGADLFCRSEGLGRAESWKTFQAGRTFVAGANDFCTSGNCTGFSQVTCQPVGYAEPEPVRKNPTAKPRSRTYDRPQVSGLVVDHCETLGRNCGRGGADQLCRSQGFDQASDWQTFPAGRTYVIGSGRACTSGNCTGFASVTCETFGRLGAPNSPAPVAPRPGPAQTFDNPKFQGYPVDHCATFGRNCGRGGAEEFCASAGFERADTWRTYAAGQSFVIGSGEVCNTGNCTALSSVTCSGSLGYAEPQQPRYNDTPATPRRDRGDGEGRRGNRGNRGDDRSDRRRDRSERSDNRPQPTGPTQRFAFPQMNGLSVDHCAREGRRCGQGGANRYCRAQGLSTAVSWNTYRPGATVYAGSNEQCIGAQCTGLKDVVCQ